MLGARGGPPAPEASNRDAPQRIRGGPRLSAVRALIALGALWLLATSAGPVRGACDGPAPAFDERIADAERIVIGQVVEHAPADVSSAGFRFSLDVIDTVKGIPAPRLDIGDLWLHPCAGPFSAGAGDVIAIAFGVRDGEFVLNPVAYLEGEPQRPDVRRVTVAEVYALAGVMPAKVVRDEPSLSILGVILLGALLIGISSALFLRRWSR